MCCMNNELVVPSDGACAKRADTSLCTSLSYTHKTFAKSLWSNDYVEEAATTMSDFSPPPVAEVVC